LDDAVSKMHSRLSKVVVWVTAALLALVFLYNRTADMNTRPLWTDEAGQVWVSGAPTAGEMHQRALTWDRHPPGYSWLLRPLALAGSKEAGLRALSVIAGILSLGCAWGMARTWLPRWEAGCVVLLIGSSPSLALYSREARPYAVALLAMILFFWMLGRHWKTPSWKTALALTLASAGATVFLYASILVVGTALLAALACDLFARVRTRGRVIGLCVSLVAVALVEQWLWAAFLQHYGSLVSTSAMYMKGLPVGSSIAGTVMFLVSGSTSLLSYLSLGHVFGPRWERAGAILGVALLILALLGLVNLWRRGGQGRALGMSILAIALAFMTLATVRLHPYGGGRHCLVLAPAVFMALAAGLGMLRTRAPRTSACMMALVMLMGLGSSARSLTPNYMIEDLPGVLRGIKEREQAGDKLVVAAPAAFAFDYYHRSSGVDDLPTTQLRLPPARIAEDLGTQPPVDASRYWLVFSHCSPSQIAALEAHFSPSCDRVDTLASNGASASCWKPRRR
jgi:hypothetical protein